MDYTWDEKGVLWLLVRWFGYEPDDDTWQRSGRLPVAAVYRYCRGKGLLPRFQTGRSRVGKPRRRDGTTERQQTLVYARTTSLDSSLAEGPGTTPANTTHT